MPQFSYSESFGYYSSIYSQQLQDPHQKDFASAFGADIESHFVSQPQKKIHSDIHWRFDGFILSRNKTNLMNIWIHRTTQLTETAHWLLEQGYLSIGFSEFSDPEFIKYVCRENGRQIFEKYVEAQYASLPSACEDLWRFVVEMRKGDKVIVPESAGYSVYELTEDLAKAIAEVEVSGCRDKNGHPVHTKDDGGLYAHTGELIDLGFVRRVTLVQKNINPNYGPFSGLTPFLKMDEMIANVSHLGKGLEEELG